MVRNNKGKGRGREKGEGKGGAGGGVAEIAGHLCSVGHPPPWLFLTPLLISPHSNSSLYAIKKKQQQSSLIIL